MTTDNPTRDNHTPASKLRSKPLRDYSDSPLNTMRYRTEQDLDEQYESNRHLIQARQQDEAIAAACQDAKAAVRIMHEAINALPPSNERDHARENMIRVESYLRAVVYAINPDGEV